jgi:hypothetical protein
MNAPSLRRVFPAFAFLLVASPAFAQFGIPSIVFDPRAFTQTSLTAVQTKAMLDQLLVMSNRLPGMQRYRIPGLPPPPVFVPHSLENLLRFYLNEAIHPLIASHAGTIDAIDQIIFTAQHQVGAARQMDEMISPVIDVLEHDVTTNDPTRSMAAALDAMNASQLVARREGQAGQALLTSLVELQTLKAEQDREAAWRALIMRAGFLAQREYVGDTTSWATWRFP